ncbi:uncharacterized protein LOC121639810 isoform X1 [Melanotaenia boesemani]|uniref:uncharacterized protein LOC121639810 isoform X1 n=1 Tax=Melanotaenia boesemani TaxID=1250792 RepID=UPI001C04F11E|nr:uncharacterized protein LOC121639810 isoform X1 [Melanotaenia boesemani]
MICRMLLLLILISSVCAATFVVNVTQSSYQAEENHNITLEWTFTTKPDVSWRFLFITCNLITDPRVPVLYHVHEGVEVPESQDGQFAGRVQSDKDVLREGRITLHVSRLRTNDSGLYVCDVKTDYGFSSGRCDLSVTAPMDHPEPERNPETPDVVKENQGHTSIYCGLILTTAILVFGAFYFLTFSLEKKIFPPLEDFRSRSSRSSFPNNSFV